MNRDRYIGQIVDGVIFRGRKVLYIGPYENRSEWTSEYLRQVADKLDELEFAAFAGAEKIKEKK